MITYRSFKKLLGETSLERKCRFLFGGGLMVLITGSFWFYAHRTAQIVQAQNEQTARTLVRKVLLSEHQKIFIDKAIDANGTPDEDQAASSELQRWLAEYQDNVGKSTDALSEFEVADEYSWTVNGAKTAADRHEEPLSNAQEVAYKALQSTDEYLSLIHI